LGQNFPKNVNKKVGKRNVRATQRDPAHSKEQSKRKKRDDFWSRGRKPPPKERERGKKAAEPPDAV